MLARLCQHFCVLSFIEKNMIIEAGCNRDLISKNKELYVLIKKIEGLLNYNNILIKN